ncbi:MAG: hypothetical protein ACE5GT_12945 [Rhodospirillales bacterium]
MGPPTRVASLLGGVDELQSSTGVSFGSAAAFGFREEARPSFERGSGRGTYYHHPHAGLVNAPTQDFAAMLESAETVTAGAPGDVSSTRFSGLVSEAIKIYETNASVIAGTNNVLGTSVSMVL